MPHKAKEKFKTEHNVFDRFTNRILFKLIQQGFFEGIESTIALGKEANVFSAKRKDGKRVVVKIYRLEAAEYNGMYDVLKADPRYHGLRGKKRKIIFAWAQREYRNLMKVREKHVHAPTPYTFNHNVLVMEYFGNSQDVASKLIHDKPKKLKEFFSLVVEEMKKLNDLGMVHGDLSGFNILNDSEKPVLIDFSQSVTDKHPEFDSLLKRDVKNVCSLFEKWGLKIDREKVLKEIMGE